MLLEVWRCVLVGDDLEKIPYFEAAIFSLFRTVEMAISFMIESAKGPDNTIITVILAVMFSRVTRRL